MNKDEALFTNIANRIINLTTTDEYGSSRTQDIETFADLSSYLNSNNILPPCGEWNESNLRTFLHRTKKRYGVQRLYDACDHEFIGRTSWEYASYTRNEEVCERRSQRKQVPMAQEKSNRKSKNLYAYFYQDVENWKSHEIDEIIAEENKMQKNHFSDGKL